MAAALPFVTRRFACASHMPAHDPERGHNHDRTSSPRLAQRSAGPWPTPPPWLKVENGMTQPQFAGRRDRGDAVRPDHGRLRPRRQARPGARAAVPARRDRDAGHQGAGHLRAQPVPLQHRRRRRTTTWTTRRAAAGGLSPSDQPARASTRDARAKAVPDLPGSLDNYWVPRGYAVVLGESIGTGVLRRLPHRRRPEGDARHQGGHRLAQRPGRRRGRGRASRSPPTGPPATSA